MCGVAGSHVVFRWSLAALHSCLLADLDSPQSSSLRGSKTTVRWPSGRAKDALLACARGWRTLTEHGLHSRCVRNGMGAVVGYGTW